MDEKKLRELITEVATQVYNNLGTRYGVSSTPVHSHDGVDTVKVPSSSVEGFNTIPAQPKYTGTADTGSILANAYHAGQFVNRAYSDSSIVRQPKIMVYPIPVVYGHGVSGDASVFNYGIAPDNTLVFFDNGSLSNLWIKTANAWYGINIDSTHPL